MALRGSLLVGQGGGPTAVINASLLGVVEKAREQKGVERVLGARFGLVGLLGNDLIDLGQQDAAHLRVVGRSPSAALGTCRRRYRPEDAGRVLETLSANEVRCFVYIGGNDSAETAHQIQMLADRQRYELACIGVPKTIDNDLAQMDHTPGYGSAARYVALAARDCAYDGAAIATTDRVTILEVMGRNAGWLAAASVLGRTAPDDAPHLVYVPEQAVVANEVVGAVKRVLARAGYCVIVVTETVRDETGAAWARGQGADEFGHVRLMGAAERLATLIEEKVGVKARFNKPGSLQRSAGWCVSGADWQEAYLVGRAAVAAAAGGARDAMVTLLRPQAPEYRCTTGLAPLAEIAHAERRLPPEFLGAPGEIAAAFEQYARPLIGEALPPYARLLSPDNDRL